MKRMLSMPRGILVAPLLLAGCASLPEDWGRSGVAAATAARGQALPQGEAVQTTQNLLAEPLTADAAITLALLNNPSLRLKTAQLGFAAAEVYDAARLANPTLRFSRLASNDPAAVSAQIGIGIAVSFTDLLLLPARSRYAAARFAAVQQEVGSAALGLAADAETAWVRAAAAEQASRLRARIAEAAETSAALAERYFAAGNIPRRALALEQASATQARLDADAAAAESLQAHSVLQRVMGLRIEQDRWTLAAGLSPPLAEEDRLDALLPLAREQRLDVLAARSEADALAKAYGLTRHTAWIGSLEAGAERERETDGSRLLGPTLAWQIPLFNWGQGERTRAEAALLAAEAELARREQEAGNEVKAGHAALLATKVRAERYRTQLIPQREAVVQGLQREANAMLVGVFEVIAAWQQEYEAYAGYLAAVRDYWLARSALTRAVGQRLPSAAQPRGEVLSTETLLAPASAGDADTSPMPESHHHHSGEH